jgi:hypothetical protein
VWASGAEIDLKKKKPEEHSWDPRYCNGPFLNSLNTCLDVIREGKANREVGAIR